MIAVAIELNPDLTMLCNALRRRKTGCVGKHVFLPTCGMFHFLSQTGGPFDNRR